MLRYAADYGAAATEGTEYAPKWDSLIETSLALLSDSQCADTGLVVSDCISNMRWRERPGVLACLHNGRAGTPHLVRGLLTWALANVCVCPHVACQPNWYVPNDGTTGCSGSGTPAAEFGCSAVASL